jgi:histidinol-phosphate aminotransferase
VPAGAAAGELRDRLEAGGLLVRHFAQERLNDALRITVGTPEQNDRLLSLLSGLLSGR